jgi:hypothetical protein
VSHTVTKQGSTVPLSIMRGMFQRIGTLWERPERSKPTPEEQAPSRLESTVTEDVVKSNEEGIDYTPPVEPPPDEE